MATCNFGHRQLLKSAGLWLRSLSFYKPVLVHKLIGALALWTRFAQDPDAGLRQLQRLAFIAFHSSPAWGQINGKFQLTADRFFGGVFPDTGQGAKRRAFSDNSTICEPYPPELGGVWRPNTCERAVPADRSLFVLEVSEAGRCQAETVAKPVRAHAVGEVATLPQLVKSHPRVDLSF